MRLPILSRTDIHEVSEFANAGGEIIGARAATQREISYLPLLEGRWLNEMDETAEAQCDRPWLGTDQDPVSWTSRIGRDRPAERFAISKWSAQLKRVGRGDATT